MIRLRQLRGVAGFTLVEVMASLVVFAIMTLGIVPLLASSMRGGRLSQSETVAENTARNVLEHIEGVKWYSGYDVQPTARRVDLLDLYFPLGSGAASSGFLPGQSYTTGTNAPVTGTGGNFTTVCPPPSGTNPACAFAIPPGYATAVKASFVSPNSGTNPQTYQFVTPPSTYAWNVTGKDTPPAKYLDITVTVTWTSEGATRSFKLRSILGDRHFQSPVAVDAGPSPTASPSSGLVPTGSIQLSGSADVDYGVQFNTGFSTATAQPSTGCPTAPCSSDLSSLWGISHSSISSQDTATASQDTSAGISRVTRAYPSTQTPPATPPPDLSSVERAKIDVAAPPSVAATTVSDPANSITWVTHPDLANANEGAFFANTVATTGVDAGQNPSANGNLKQNSNLAGQNAFGNYQSQASLANMHLVPSNTQMWVQALGTTPFDGFTVSTSAVTGAMGTSGRRVETIATEHVPLLEFLMLNLDQARTNKSFIEILPFDASVDCKATGNPATASATATWSSTMNLYYDVTPGDRKQQLSLFQIPLGSAKPTDPLAAYGTGPGQSNPRLYDSPSSSGTPLYLFNDPATGKLGYLESWSSEINESTNVSNDGRTASASIDGAIRINTVPMGNTGGPGGALNNADTAVNLSIGKLSCDATDNR